MDKAGDLLRSLWGKNWKVTKVSACWAKVSDLGEQWSNTTNTVTNSSPVLHLFDTDLNNMNPVLSYSSWTPIEKKWGHDQLQDTGDDYFFDLCVASDPPWAEGQGLTGLGRIKPSVYKTLKAVIPSKMCRVFCKGFWPLLNYDCEPFSSWASGQ